MNPNLIPSPDMLGLPMQPALLLVLLNVLLALHWLFIGATFGGAFVVLHHAGQRDTSRQLSQAVLGFLPFMLSMGVTLGIAPLLFVQVLYGNFFYTANVLLGAMWLSIVPLVIANLYLFYVARKRLRAGRPVGWLGAVMVLIFLVLAMILSSNMTLMQTPGQWMSLWQHRGFGLFTGSGMFYRLAVAVAGFLAIGGLFVAILAKARFVKEAPAAEAARKSGLNVAIVAAVLQVAALAVLVWAMDEESRQYMLHHAPTAWFAYGLAGLVILALPLLAWARAKTSWPVLVLAVADYLLAGIALAFVRDDLRQFVLKGDFQLISIPIHPQWGPFTLFACFLVAGLAAIVVLLKLATTRRSSTPTE